MATVQQVNWGLRTKANTEKNPLATFDPVAFDSIIYRQSRLRPPPGVRLSSHIVENGSASRKSERVYLPVNPAIHKMHKRSQHWHKQKCKDIERRPKRKAWFGKVEARLRWLRAEEERLEQSRQNAQDDGTMPPFEPPEPRCFKQILDFGDVPEKELPEYVRNDPAWSKACAWLRKCEEENTQYPRKVDKLGKKPERYSAEGETSHVNRFNRMEGIEHHDRESTNTLVNDTTTDDASEIPTPHSSQYRSSELMVHERRHAGQKPYKCDHENCNKSFNTPSHRTEHQKIHNKEKPYKCDHKGCDKSFKTSSNLKQHQETHNKEKPYKCDHKGCDKSFKTSSNRNHHQKTHNKEKLYKCDHEDCNKYFTSPYKLERHQNTHNKQKPYKCDHEGCNRSYTTSSNRNKHQKNHSKEMFYKCDYKDCDKSFTTSYRLNQHQRFHTEEMPYGCHHKNCHKCFTTSSELMVHERRHAGEKPYECDYKDCDKSFTTPYKLERHQGTHTIME